MVENVIVACNSGNFVEAVQLHEEEIIKSGSVDANSDYYYSLAKSYRELKNYSEAVKYFQKAIELYPSNLNLYYDLGKLLFDVGKYKEASDILRRGYKISSSDTQIQYLLNKMPRLFNDYYPNQHLVKEQQDKLNEYYWCSDITVKEIKKRFRLPDNAKDYFSYLIHRYKFCPNCDANLVYKSRSRKSLNQAECEICSHQENYKSCYCDYCKKVREEEEKRRKERERMWLEEDKRRKEKEMKKKLEKVSTLEYIDWAISKLNAKEKFFTKVLFEIMETGQDTSWKNICEKTGTESHEKYLKRLISLSFILLDTDNKLIINPAVKSEMIEILEIEEPDYIPVTPDNTSEFFSDNWKENMRRKKEESLNNRLKRLDEVKEYWLSCRGYWHLSSYDEKFINSFIQRYEPEWIKKAIKIAVDKNIPDCGKYVAGILKNWLEHGFPDDEMNLRLSQKPATENQISYVRSLLEINKITLEDCCGKSDFNYLTMLDAKNIISELGS